MKGKSASLEARESAFQAYRECGGNVEATLRRLREIGYSLSKPTLYDWIRKFNFKERLARADLKAQEARDAALTTEEQLLSSLIQQKEKYEAYFDGLGRAVDNQAQYAYTNLVKTIIDIKAKMGADRAALFLTFLKDLVSYLAAEDPEAVPFIERNFDDFVAHAREKYGS